MKILKGTTQSNNQHLNGRKGAKFIQMAFGTKQKNNYVTS